MFWRGRTVVQTESAAEGTGRTVLRKATVRLIPFLFVLYIVSFLDRVNVSFAALQMNEDLGFSDAVYGLGAGIFFIGYFLFEVPSNLILERVGARVWIARIMITWGIISTAMFLVTGPVSFYLLRFLLGVAEAGFFPGIILYLTYWFPARERAKAVALFMTAVAIAGVIGGPLSGALLSLDEVVFGLSGWQFLFIAEGFPAILLGLAVLAFLPDRPSEARWLTDEERRWLEDSLSREEQLKTTHGTHTLRQAFVDGRLWLLCGVYFGTVTSLYGISFWLPTIIEEFSNLNEFLVGLLSAFPYLAAAIGMVVFAWHSDRTGERRWHVAIPAGLAALGLALTGPIGASPVAQMAVLALAAMGTYSCLGTFWTLPATFLGSTAAAAGIALINSVGNLGGFVGPYVVGYIREATGSGYGAMLFLAALMALVGLLTLAVRHEITG
jgi:MFS transporter, ACS family, tartrate transporter